MDDSKIKTYKGEWYTINSILANTWARFFILCGGREAGKSYSVMRWANAQKMRKKEHCKFYWFRLTDTQADKLLENNGDKLVDPDIKRKYNLHFIRKGNTLYTYDEEKHISKTGKETIEKVNKREFCTVLSCSTFYTTKGVGYFDNEYDGEYIIVLDEMNREQSEKNSFDIVYSFVNLLENIIRSTKTKIRIFMIGNTLEEASDLLSAFNFIPDRFGRFKLKSKKCVIDYIRPSEKYKERRKDTVADILLPNASTFTNEIEIDRSLIVNKRMAKLPSQIIKFNKSKDTWFTIWNNNIIKPYNNELKPGIAMRRYLDEQYQPELVKIIFDKFDARAYRFVSVACFKQFQKQLRLIKK